MARNTSKPKLSDKSFFLELLHSLQHPTASNHLLQGQSERSDRLPGFNLVVQLEYIDLFASQTGEATLQRASDGSGQIAPLPGTDQNLGGQQRLDGQVGPGRSNDLLGLPLSIHGSDINDIDPAGHGGLDRLNTLVFGCCPPYHPNPTPTQGNGRDGKTGFTQDALLHRSSPSSGLIYTARFPACDEVMVNS